ncbi:hypothetical protein AB0O52_02500 [Arthrobacter sp. NPDC080073]|uniref:hypothetical protein n=1 Tax=Arthrobacter sp. NPDC080073 TaxID=3155919 RepID=UPI00344102AE
MALWPRPGSKAGGASRPWWIEQQVHMFMFTNYFNHLAGTEADLPPVPELTA